MKIEPIAPGIQRIYLNKGETIEGLHLPEGCTGVLIYGNIEVKVWPVYKYRGFFKQVGLKAVRDEVE